MISSRQFSWWLLFGAGLLVATAGWMWILVRLVQSESEAAQARVRQAEEKLLAREAADLSTILETELKSIQSIPELARSGTYAGWWRVEPARDSMETAPPQLLESWRNRMRDDQIAATDIAKALENGELKWGWLENGRDPVAALLLSLYKNGERSAVLADLLSERVWDFQQPTLSSAFRLTLIRPLIELQPTDELQRLLEIESIRAAQGRLDEIEGTYEVIEIRRDGELTKTYWSEDQLLRLLRSPGDYQLLRSPADDRASAHVRGLQHFPYLAAGTSGPAAHSPTGSRTLIWIGGASGLALLALAIAAVLFGRYQLRIARLRTDLAASVAHELRTPLAGQRLLLETMMESKNQDQKQREEYTAMAFRENMRLSRLAEEFLTFSRLERGVLQLEVEAVEISEVIDGAVESLREKWEDPDCHLSISIDEGLPKIAGDRQALITVLRNLLENAWKYSESPRNIRVNATADGDEARITVSDDGMGLSAKEQQRIFRQFYQVDQSLARSQEGLGLGLSIVKRLLESMESRIEVASEQGKGSHFTIRIPLFK
jgi:signal transduction histidine kinase